MLKVGFLDSGGGGGKKTKSNTDYGFPPLVDDYGIIHIQEGGSSIVVQVSDVNAVNISNDPSNTGLVTSIPTPGMSNSYANVTGKPSRKSVNFRTLFTPSGNGVHVVVLVESIRVISERFANTTYGFFLKKRVAYPVVANYVRNTWGNYGLVKSMFNSSIGTMIELRADAELKDTIVVAMPKLAGERFYTCTIRVEYEWKLPRCVCCNVFGHIQEECPKNIGSGEAKNLKKPSKAPRGVLVGPKVDYSGDHDSDDEVESVDNDMTHFLALEMVGFGTNNLLEQ
uniref:Zinc knuckle CX2CX4HX4C n=1 Tax=Tanacetum cinerariifolium TaxID=118510 RepID=A0A6L2JC63_TANCI|nr:hypothetical protein [Tanacetum cinerariifolium]